MQAIRHSRPSSSRFSPVLLKEGEHLTPLEAEVLEVLIRSRPRVMSRSEIFKALYDADLSETSNMVGVVIGHLRRKLVEPERLRTVRSFGYQHVAP